MGWDDGGSTGIQRNEKMVSSDERERENKPQDEEKDRRDGEKKGREREDSRFLESEVVPRLELFSLIIESFLVRSSSFVGREIRVLLIGLLLGLLGFGDDLVVGRDVILRAIDPTSVEDVAAASEVKRNRRMSYPYRNLRLGKGAIERERLTRARTPRPSASSPPR